MGSDTARSRMGRAGEGGGGTDVYGPAAGCCRHSTGGGGDPPFRPTGDRGSHSGTGSMAPGRGTPGRQHRRGRTSSGTRDDGASRMTRRGGVCDTGILRGRGASASAEAPAPSGCGGGRAGSQGESYGRQVSNAANCFMKEGATFPGWPKTYWLHTPVGTGEEDPSTAPASPRPPRTRSSGPAPPPRPSTAVCPTTALPAGTPPYMPHLLFSPSPTRLPPRPFPNSTE